ncbi:hypothetical protein [Fodinicola feengrottensis]|uniref:hypothetical protein n=1 Tax=Fodinicola feengrottensis TaxID=435914 RepID=UPI002442D2A9|nr:hypothetical protein [Fodinicola feengrottensis]
MPSARTGQISPVPRLPDEAEPARVPVGPFSVVDLPRLPLADYIARSAVAAVPSRPYLAFALHVGGLNHRTDADFVASMRKADVIYADGASVVGLARLAGARVIGRSVTTDLGWDVLRRLETRQGRPLRLALIGGPIGLAGEAGAVLAEKNCGHRSWLPNTATSRTGPRWSTGSAPPARTRSSSASARPPRCAG